MILSSLDNAARYCSLHAGFQKAFDFLARNGAASLAPGRISIDGDMLYALVSENEGKGRGKARLEAHRKYIDIQYVVSGTECIGWKPTGECGKQEQPYDVIGDIAFYADEALVWHAVLPGHLVILFPEDAHAPLAGNGAVRKIVLKVAVE